MAKAKGMRIRTDDAVIVTGGKDRGKTGKVIRTDPKKSFVYVEGLNIVKRHQRPTSVKESQKGAQVGGIVEKEGPIHVSNVMLLDPSNNKPTRVRIERGAGGKRKRVAAKTGTAID
jgi:large subunit ribosomal protein L24